MPKNQLVQYAPVPQQGMMQAKPVTIGAGPSPVLGEILRNQRQQGPGVPIRSDLGGFGHAFSMGIEPWIEKAKNDAENQKTEALIAQLEGKYDPATISMIRMAPKPAIQALLQAQMAGQQADTAHKRALEIEALRGRNALSVAQIKKGKEADGYDPKGNIPKSKDERELVRSITGDVRKFQSLDKEFKPEYGGGGMGLSQTLADIENDLASKQPELVEALYGKDKVEAARWWRQYNRNFVLTERHELFGSALTEGEQRSWNASDINPAMNGDEIRKNLETRRAIVMGKYREQMNYLRATYDNKWLSQTFGFDVANDKAMEEAFNRFLPPITHADTKMIKSAAGTGGSPITTNAVPEAQQPQQMPVQEAPPPKPVEQIPVEQHAEVQQQAVEAIKQGYSPAQVAEKLKARGIPIPPQLEVILGQVTPVDPMVAP